MFYRDNRAEIVAKIARLIQQSGDTTFKSNEITEALELGEEDLRRAGPWPNLLRTTPWTITTTAVYDTGTVLPTLASTTLTGSGLTFTAAMVGRKVRIEGDWRYYRIAAFVSAAEVTLNEAYENDDLAGTNRNYKIFVDEYNLPMEFGSVYDIRHEKSTVEFERKNQARFFSDNPVAYQMGDPYYFDVPEHTVENQTVTTGVLTLLSSSASDDGKKVLLRGLVSGVKDYEEKTLSGSTDTSKSFSRVDQVIKNLTTFVGKLTVTDSAGITIHTIPPEYLQVTRRKLWLYPYPEYKIRIFVSGYELPPRLIRDMDVPLISPDLYVHAALPYVLMMAGEWSKATTQMGIVESKIQKEKEIQNADQDNVMTLLPDTEHYPLGGPFG